MATVHEQATNYVAGIFKSAIIPIIFFAACHGIHKLETNMFL